MATAYDIIIRPIITERAMAGAADKKYVFEVAKNAGKVEIKKAVEEIFGVKVASVNTLTVPGKEKRMGAGRPGMTRTWKKAYVQLTADSKTMPPKGYVPQGAIPVTAPQKTMPPRGYAPPQPAPAPEPTAPPQFHGPSVLAAGRTVGMMQEQMGFDPVVGWLACVEGPSRGKSYTIRGGINSIGRGDRMDITITGDRTISMENHAKISYSDRNNRFNLLPGDGRNIVYLNGEEVFAATPLNAYDLIDFGETKLLFVPLCGEQFTWKKEEDHGTV